MIDLDTLKLPVRLRQALAGLDFARRAADRRRQAWNAAQAARRAEQQAAEKCPNPYWLADSRGD